MCEFNIWSSPLVAAGLALVFWGLRYLFGHHCPLISCKLLRNHEWEVKAMPSNVGDSRGTSRKCVRCDAHRRDGDTITIWDLRKENRKKESR